MGLEEDLLARFCMAISQSPADQFRGLLDPQGKVVDEEWLLEHLRERVRALVQSPEGWLYLSTDSDKILRLRPE